MNSLCEKLHNKWPLAASLPILLLLGVWCYLIQKQPFCAELPILENADEWKFDFCEKFNDIISKEYYAMIQRSYQMEINLYRNVYADLSITDRHSELLRDILQAYNVTNEIIHHSGMDSKEKRLKVMQIWANQGIRHTKLTHVTTKDYDVLDYRKILEKNNFVKYKYVMAAELIETFENIQEYWQKQVTCIPTQYYHLYPELPAMNALFQKFIASTNEKEKLQIIGNLLLELEHLEFFAPFYMNIAKDILYNFFFFTPYVNQYVDY